MSYIVKPLSSELAENFAGYLENLDFNHAPHWASCYCVYYHTDRPFEEWKNRTGSENRAEAMEQIRSGYMKGYLAFDNDKCIGWCNANDVHRFKRLEKDLSSIVMDKKVGCVICFVIHPEYRKQGVARLLLKNAVEGFREQGFGAVLSIPVDNIEVPEMQYRGTMNMYKELGFEEIKKEGNSSVMWLDL